MTKQTINSLQKYIIPGGLILLLILIIVFTFPKIRSFFRKIQPITGFENAEIDWAKSGTVSQSSTFSNGIENDIPQHGIDGNPNSYTATNWENQPWWQVKLTQPVLITKIVINNRVGNRQWALSNFNVIIYNSGSLVHTIPYPGTVNDNETFPGINIVGDLVKIQFNGTGLLNMSEVNVFGTSTNKDIASTVQNKTIINLNSLAVASQSTNASNTSYLAQDALYQATSQTNPEAAPWWQATFPTLIYLSNITISGINNPTSWYGIHYLDENNKILLNVGYNQASLNVNVDLIVKSVKVYRPISQPTTLFLTGITMSGYQIIPAKLSSNKKEARPGGGGGGGGIPERPVRYNDTIILMTKENNFISVNDSVMIKSPDVFLPEEIKLDATSEYFTLVPANGTNSTNVISKADVVFLRTWDLSYVSISPDSTVTLNKFKNAASPLVITAISSSKSKSNSILNKEIEYGNEISFEFNGKYLSINEVGMSLSSTGISFNIYDKYGNGGKINWARQGIPTMSSASNTAIAAIDGQPSSYTLSNLEDKPWWSIELPLDIIVNSMEFSNRADAYQDRLADFDVFFYNSLGNLVSTFYFPKSQPTYVIPVITSTARTVKIQLRGANYLSISSVKIYGKQANLIKNIDWAKTGITSMSSDWTGSLDNTLPSYHGNNAIDGDINTFSMTKPEQGAWWMIKLLKTVNITEVYLVNRQDCCQDRLADFNVLFLDDKQNIIKTITQKDHMNIYYFTPNVQARYVKIALNQVNWLQLAEVNIYGTEAELLSNSSALKKLVISYPDDQKTVLNDDLPLFPNGNMSMTFNVTGEDGSILNKNLMPSVDVHNNKLLVTVTTTNGQVILSTQNIGKSGKISVGIIITSKISTKTGWDYIKDNSVLYYVNNGTKEYIESQTKSPTEIPRIAKLDKSFTNLNYVLTDANNLNVAKIYVNSRLVQSRNLQSIPLFNNEDLVLSTLISNLKIYNYSLTGISEKNYSKTKLGINLLSGLNTPPSNILNFDPNMLPEIIDEYSISFWFKAAKDSIWYTYGTKMVGVNSGYKLATEAGVITTVIPGQWYKYDERYQNGKVTYYLNNNVVLTKIVNRYDFSDVSLSITGEIFQMYISNYSMSLDLNNEHPESESISDISKIWKDDLKCPNTLPMQYVNKVLSSNNFNTSLNKLKEQDRGYTLCYGTVAGNLIAKYTKKDFSKDPNYAKIKEQEDRLIKQRNKLTETLRKVHINGDNNASLTTAINLIKVKELLSSDTEWKQQIEKIYSVINSGVVPENVITKLNGITGIDIETKSASYMDLSKSILWYSDVQQFAKKIR